ncbi:ABC transporter ATP-binding protein [Fibrobacterota bacterium]
MLQVENLSVSYRINGLPTAVCENVSFALDEGETLGIVGESGCGKTVTVQALAGLLNPRAASVSAEVLRFNGTGLLGLKEHEWRRIRGNDISMIFQNPMTSLNPLMTCGKQIREAILLHRKMRGKEARRQAVGLLKDMGISEPEQCYGKFPHELSGGMRQRVMIAMALACRPRLLIADEPTTALDVTIQAQILELIRAMQKKIGMALILITHDLGIVREMVDGLIVMYAGRIAEKGKTARVLSRPGHPYTRGLMQCLPNRGDPGKRLHSIEGTVPSPMLYQDGCRFYPRCHMREPSCEKYGFRLNGNSERSSSCQFWYKLEGES